MPELPSDAPPPSRRAREWAAEVARMNEVEDTRWVAIRAGLTVVLMLGILAATGHAGWALYAIFGGFVNIHGPGRAAHGRWRIQSVVAVAQVGAVAIGALVGLSPQRDWISVGVVPVVAVAAHAVYDHWRLVPHAPLFPILATAAVGSRPMVAADVPPAVLVTAAAAAFAVVLGHLTLYTHRDRSASVTLGHYPRTRDSTWDAALAAVAVALAGVAANLTSVGHAFWAMFSASVAMSMPRGRARAVRAVNRMVGTTAGVYLSWPLLALDLVAWQVVLLAGILQGLATMLVPRQYSLAMLVITPLALMVNQWAAPQPLDLFLQARLLETVIGAAIALLVVLLDRELSRRRLLPGAAR